MFKTFIKAINRLIDERSVGRGVRASLEVIGEPLIHTIYKYEKAYEKDKGGVNLCILLWSPMSFMTKINSVSRIRQRSGVNTVVIYDVNSFKKSGRYNHIMKTAITVYTG